MSEQTANTYGKRKQIEFVVNIGRCHKVNMLHKECVLFWGNWQSQRDIGRAAKIWHSNEVLPQPKYYDDSNSNSNKSHINSSVSFIYSHYIHARHKSNCEKSHWIIRVRCHICKLLHSLAGVFCRWVTVERKETWLWLFDIGKSYFGRVRGMHINRPQPSPFRIQVLYQKCLYSVSRDISKQIIIRGQVIHLQWLSIKGNKETIVLAPNIQTCSRLFTLTALPQNPTNVSAWKRFKNIKDYLLAIVQTSVFSCMHCPAIFERILNHVQILRHLFGYQDGWLLLLLIL